MIKKSQFVSYMVDVKGYSTDDAIALWHDFGGNVVDCLSHSELEELCEYNGIEMYAY